MWWSVDGFQVVHAYDASNRTPTHLVDQVGDNHISISGEPYQSYEYECIHGDGNVWNFSAPITTKNHTFTVVLRYERVPLFAVLGNNRSHFLLGVESAANGSLTSFNGFTTTISSISSLTNIFLIFSVCVGDDSADFFINGEFRAKLDSSKITSVVETLGTSQHPITAGVSIAALSVHEGALSADGVRDLYSKIRAELPRSLPISDDFSSNPVRSFGTMYPHYGSFQYENGRIKVVHQHSDRYDLISRGFTSSVYAEFDVKFMKSFDVHTAVGVVVAGLYDREHILISGVNIIYRRNGGNPINTNKTFQSFTTNKKSVLRIEARVCSIEGMVEISFIVDEKLYISYTVWIPSRLFFIGLASKHQNLEITGFRLGELNSVVESRVITTESKLTPREVITSNVIPGDIQIGRSNKGGVGVIRATVKASIDGEEIPVSRRVLCIDEKTHEVVDDVWSDDSTGEYEFRGLDINRYYTVLAYDHTGAFKGVVADRIKPQV